MRSFPLIVFVLAAALPCAARADVLTAGGDVFVVAPGQEDIPASGRDLLGAGISLRLTAPVAQDALLAGASVAVEQPVRGDLSAFGGRISVDAPVGGDLSLGGFAVDLGAAAEIGGNARLSGGSVTVRGPVSGALSAAGGEILLDAPVAGDANLSAGRLTFGEGARIGGQLRYSAPEAVEIPASVIPAERVSFVPFGPQAARMHRADRYEDWPLPGRGAAIGGALTGYLFFVVAGALLLAFVPRTVAQLNDRIVTKPALTLVIGLAGLGTAFGLIPILALSIIGAPLIPVILLGIVLLWMAGYLLGVFAVSVRVLSAMLGAGASPPGTGAQLAALAAGLALAMLLNFVPLLGWVVNFAALVLGVGSIVALLFERADREARAS